MPPWMLNQIDVRVFVVKLYITPKTPDKNTAGNISTDLPHLRATVKTANAIADPIAARLPRNSTPVSLSETIIPTPSKPTMIAMNVDFLTVSPSKTQPSTAAKKGAVATSNIAFATDVDCIE